jgi:hypothetical protein
MSGWAGSTSARFLTTGATAIYFKPIQFDLELADLAVELSFQLIARLLLLRPPDGEYYGQDLQQMSPPLADLVGMDTEVRGDLGDCLLPFDGFQGDLGLEGCVVCLPHTRKPAIPPFEIWQAQNALKTPAQFLGSVSVHYRRRLAT